MATRIGIIGGNSWRADFFYKIAHEFPDNFYIGGSLIRDANMARSYAGKWGIKTHNSVESLLNEDFDYVITSVPWHVNPEMVRRLVDAGVPVLSETPPAPDIPDLIELYQYVKDNSGRVQVAEQFHLRPLHQVQIDLAHSGLLGKPNQVHVSVGHGYHGISLMRRMLGVKFEKCRVISFRFVSSILKGADRSGPPQEETIGDSEHESYRFEFDGKLGLFDFTLDQYFGSIRAERILIRGTRGEISNHLIRYMDSQQDLVTENLLRHETVIDNDRKLLRGIQVGGTYYYSNPYDVPLTDEEIAVAHTMDKMAAYVKTGEPFYSLAEGCYDHYLYRLASMSAEKGEAAYMYTEDLPWDQ